MWSGWGSEMLRKMVNRLQGQVRIRVEAPFPERVINLCSSQNLAFWDLRWESEQAFCCTLSRRDYRRLRGAAEKLACTIQVEKQTGVPFAWRRFRRRRVLLGGTAACAALLVWSSFFILDFRVEGNERIPDEKILRVLERNGVRLGTYAFSIQGPDLRNHVLLELPELSWITVNVSGFCARVQVRERIPMPELADNAAPTNLVAAKDGLVLRVETLSGEKKVLPGTTVERGQLLISGVSDTDTVGARLAPGTGRVWARTWYSLETRIPLTVHKKVYTGREKSGWSLTVGDRRLKFYGNPSQNGEHYDKISVKKQLSLLGITLPVFLEREVFRFYETQSALLTAAAAQARGEQILKAALKAQMEADGEVRSELCAAREVQGVLYVTLKAECREQIGRSVPIYRDIDQPAP